ncbi:hypothetical protein DFH06DRAFT_1126334 [Mycena polygramma]|nr:hypothetical protein DFH06DRAFT_1126334 [Mycena polygramma]
MSASVLLTNKLIDPACSLLNRTKILHQQLEKMEDESEMTGRQPPCNSSLGATSVTPTFNVAQIVGCQNWGSVALVAANLEHYFKRESCVQWIHRARFHERESRTGERRKCAAREDKMRKQTSDVSRDRRGTRQTDASTLSVGERDSETSTRSIPLRESATAQFACREDVPVSAQCEGSSLRRVASRESSASLRERARPPKVAVVASDGCDCRDRQPNSASQTKPDPNLFIEQEL